MSRISEFTDANFRTEVLDSDRPVLVDFWAAWCGPCRAVSPTIDRLAERFGDDVKIGKLNIDENPRATRELKIQSIPTVLLFEQGQVVETLVGVQAPQRYEQALRSRLAPRDAAV